MKLNKTILVTSVVFSTAFFSCQSGKEKLAAEIKKSENELIDQKSKAMDPEKGKAMVILYLKYVDQYPEDTLGAGYLFNAADITSSLKDQKKAIGLLDRLQSIYPKDPRASSALFVQGFLFDTELHMKDSAIARYHSFIQKYPNDPLIPSAVASLQQIESGMSDEEMVRKFQQMNDSLNAGAN